tara:strand:- start:252 stop:1175 length:924 start_codon:yes stop_codon:yes gene_type:complete
VKIYLNRPKETWVVDRFVEEWLYYNKALTTKNILSSDIIWITSPWTWKKLNKKILKRKVVLCTVHHIDEEKFDSKARENFQELDQYVDYYHTISEYTKKQVANLTQKPIFRIPFWVNQHIWYEIEDKIALRNKYSLNTDSFYIGSFQRDTEGHDLISPKLSKGPDQFFKIVSALHERNKDTVVLLTGKRRQYLIERFNKNSIPYKYFEMVDFRKLNDLYNCLDLYIVASRIEGGPQSILETSLTRTPLISTDVGIAKEILHPRSIFNLDNFLEAQPNIEYAFKNTKKLTIPSGFKDFIRMFEEISEN